MIKLQLNHEINDEIIRNINSNGNFYCYYQEYDFK